MKDNEKAVRKSQEMALLSEVVWCTVRILLLFGLSYVKFYFFLNSSFRPSDLSSSYLTALLGTYQQ